MRGAIGGPRVLLRRLREVMAEPVSAQDRLDKIVVLIAANMVAEVCSVYVLRVDGRLELYATEGLKPEAVHNTVLAADEGLVGLVASEANPINLSEAQSHPAFSYRAETGEEIYHSFLGVPILRAGNTLGVLVVQNRAHFVPRFGGSPVDPSIRASVAEAARRLAALGHGVDEDPAFDLANGVNQLAWPVISQTALAWLMTQHPDSESLLSEPLQQMLGNARKLTAAQYLGALNEVAGLRRRVAELFETIDIVMTPTTAALPWSSSEVYPSVIDGQQAGPRAHAVFTAFVNAAGLPAITIPAEPSPDGLPIGFQLIGRPGAEGELCAIAKQFEAAHPWANRWPAL